MRLSGPKDGSSYYTDFNLWQSTRILRTKSGPTPGFPGSFYDF